ncbi:MAG: hypothetical protein ACRCZI_15730 [Cetobacterium sp.]
MQNAVTTQHLVVWVNQQRLPMAEVVRLSGLTRQAIWKRLRYAGCLIPRRVKGGAPGVMIETACAFCSQPIRRHKRKMLKLKTLRSFCSMDCYAASLAQSGYVEYRHGSRLARAIVAQHFALEPQHIVHHKDGDQRNNDRANFLVFASQADHMAHHRGRSVVALWDGAV